MSLLFSIISVRAKSFAEREIRYTLKAENKGAGTFNIGPTTGNVRLAKDLDFEDHRYPHVYKLIVTATEDSGGFSTSVEVLTSIIYSKTRSIIRSRSKVQIPPSSYIYFVMFMLSF